LVDTQASRRGVLLELSYDGRTFSGWARQKNARTVAGELAGAIAVIDPKASQVRGVSRTDAGVHARAQIASFDTDKDISPRGWVLALQQQLPSEIGVMRSARVPPGYDPRGHVVHKTYRYQVVQTPVPDPFWRGRAWQVRERLNHEAMAREAEALLGTHDFRAFRSSKDQRDITVRTILRAAIEHSAEDPRRWHLEVMGDRFLHRMVRIIAGTLIDVGRSRLPTGAVARALESHAREDLGMTAPPDGLYLHDIELDMGGTDEWPDQFSNR
jgi:tRNA pseudouridine38-40 synthase